MAGAVFGITFLPVQLSPSLTVIAISAGLFTVYYLMKSAYQIDGSWPEGYLKEAHEEKFFILVTPFIYIPARYHAWKTSVDNREKTTEDET